jgi:multidrug efflux pump subunit AcrB
LPLAIVLIVPMCLLASVTGLLARGLPIDILSQIGFVVLVGLAAKNAILIVDFARQKRGKSRRVKPPRTPHLRAFVRSLRRGPAAFRRCVFAIALSQR